MANPYPRLSGVTVTIGCPSSFVVMPENSDKRERWESDSEIVLAALLPAALTGSRVTVEFVEGPTNNVIRRVEAYAIDPVFFYSRGDYKVSRIATQRKPDGSDEHLEVFLDKDNKPYKTFNIFDSRLQRILLSVFAHRQNPTQELSLDVEIEDDQIVGVTIGEK